MKDIFKHQSIILFKSFFYIGLFTVGGGLAMLPFIEKEFVDSKKWLTKDEMIDIFAISQSLPGVIAVNSSLLTGFKIAGNLGALMAAFGTMLPSFIIILIIASVFKKFEDIELVNKAFMGIRPALTALILMSTIGITKQVVKNKLNIIIFVLSFIFILFFNISVIYVLLASAFVGMIFCFLKKDKCL